MRRIGRWMALAPTARGWAAATAAANIVTSLISATLIRLGLDAHAWLAQIGYGIGAIVAITVSAALIARATSIRDAQFPDHPKVILKMTRAISQAMEEENSLVGGSDYRDVRKIRTRALMGIKLYLRALEDVLSHSWSEERFGATTELEAVIMNKAQDGYVTVGAWAHNRPRSLNLRAQNPAFYDKTEAAKLYRKFDDVGVRAPIHIIPDISRSPNYDHFGRDPSIRTNSTALFPIYDRQSRLHGFVAVTARNRVGLFDDRDRAFWKEVWSLWEPHFVRNVVAFESTGQALDEQVVK